MSHKSNKSHTHIKLIEDNTTVINQVKEQVANILTDYQLTVTKHIGNEDENDEDKIQSLTHLHANHSTFNLIY